MSLRRRARRAAVNGANVLGRSACDRAPALAARRVFGAAARLHGKASLRSSWRSTAACRSLVAFGFVFAFPAALRALEPGARAARCRRRAADRMAAGNSRAQRRFEKSPCEQDFQQVFRGHGDPVARARGRRSSARAARGGACVRRRGRGRATGLCGDVRARAPGAQLAQDARHRGERRAVQRFGPVRRDDRVEHQRFDVARVVLRVLLGDLRAVAGAVQDELFVAAGLADRLDVGDRVGGRVEARARPELAGALRDRRPRRAVVERLFEAVAGQRVRQADPALVEDDQVARGGDRPEQFGELFGERQRRLPRSAGERDHGAVRFADRRAVAAHRERDRAGRAPLGSSGTVRWPQAKFVAVPARGQTRSGRCAGPARRASPHASVASSTLAELA